MQLYSSNGVIDTGEFNLYSQGTCASIYKKDALILKEYKFNCKYCYMISTSVFQLLKELQLPHIVKLYDAYYTDTSFWKYFLKMDAYTMEYAGERIDSLLESSREYFLEMVLELERLLPLLTRYRILLNDTNSYNIIFSKNDVTIIDPDLFCVSKWHSSSFILKYNQNALLEYIISTLLKDARMLKEDDSFLYDICRLRMISLDSLSSSFSRIFTEDSPYLSLKKHRSW